MSAACKRFNLDILAGQSISEQSSLEELREDEPRTALRPLLLCREGTGVGTLDLSRDCSDLAAARAEEARVELRIVASRELDMNSNGT